MKPRMIFIHGNGTTDWAGSPWTSWLKGELDKLSYPTIFHTFPDSVNTRAKFWLPHLKDDIKAGPDDVLIGWSSGGTACMRYAEENQILGSVLISPSYTDLGEEFERQAGWYDTPWDWEKIKKNQEKIALVYGDNDPYIPQTEFEHIKSMLQAETICVPGAEHFIERTEMPEVLEYIKKTY